jgi:hypothetical protein
MKTIEKPEPLALGEGKTMPFDVFVGALLNSDDRFNSNGRGIRAAVRIEQALKECVDADSLKLEDDDHALLAQVIEAPTGGYPVRPSRFCVTFIDAIVKA